MTRQSGLVRVLIPTTEGLATVDDVRPETAGLGESLAMVAGTHGLAAISDAYSTFIGDVSEVFEPLSNRREWRLELSRNIEAGRSWEAGALLAHALQNAGRLATGDAQAESVVWVTGTIAQPDLAIGPVDHVTEKLRLSFSHLSVACVQGSEIIIAVPTANNDEFDEELRKTATDAGYDVIAVATIDDLGRKLGLPAMVRKADKRRLTSGKQRLAFIGAAVASLVFGGVWAAQNLAGRQLDLSPIVFTPNSFKHCDACPVMVAMPTGGFTMGSPTDDLLRRFADLSSRPVAITKRIAMGRTEVTVEQFDIFVKASGYAYNRSCQIQNNKTQEWSEVDASYVSPPKPLSVGSTYPVVCVSWRDAVAYVSWLAKETGHAYRLPTEAEWEFAARAGTQTRFSFGNDQKDLCDYAWVADLGSPWGAETKGCRVVTTRVRDFGPSPVGLLLPNPWGLHDMHGNVWEWVADCWSVPPSAGPTTQQAWVEAESCVRTTRGGSFANGGGYTRSAARYGQKELQSKFMVGFRVALSLDK